LLRPDWPAQILKLSGGNHVDKADVTSDAVKICDNQSELVEESKPNRKKFVTPQISIPVDVLEATTFFQLTDSGVIS
jgi:hypothetical protein